jgi:hypothetical protein
MPFYPRCYRLIEGFGTRVFSMRPRTGEIMLVKEGFRYAQ